MKQLVTIMFIGMASTLNSCSDKAENTRADSDKVITTENVPPSVITAFRGKYANTSEVIWETAHENDLKTYKVKFKVDGKYMKAEFGESGQFIKEKEDK